MKELSRFLDTEASYHDRDLTQAKHGAAVLAVQRRDERAKKAAWLLIALQIHWLPANYPLSGIEHLAGEK